MFELEGVKHRLFSRIIKIPENCSGEHNYIFAHIFCIIYNIIVMFLFILLCIPHELNQIVRYILCEGLPRINCADI